MLGRGRIEVLVVRGFDALMQRAVAVYPGASPFQSSSQIGGEQVALKGCRLPEGEADILLWGMGGGEVLQ